MIRRAAVAGSFYPRNQEQLMETIEECFRDADFGPGEIIPNRNSPSKCTILGGVCPHAGYVYSGAATAHTIKAIFEERCPETVIILGTQHTGYYGISVMRAGKWETPLGNISIDNPIAEAILSRSTLIKADNAAFTGSHAREHNIEVQLPFLQYAAQQYKKQLEIVPITLGDMNLNHLEQVAKEIASVIKETKKDIVLIASSDMTHKQPRNYYQPAEDLNDMRERDTAVFDAVTRYDWKNVYENALKTTVCGPQTIVTGMLVCQERGAKSAEVLKYYTSYEKMGGSGPCEYSVGYLSAIFTL